MNNIEIIDVNGNIINVSGIYYISPNNNYYFIYTKGEKDSDSHVVFYVVKILQEIINGTQGTSPTGYLIGIRINDDNEYDIVKKDIAKIIGDKENNNESVRYLKVSMLNNLKIRDNRTFKLGIDTYNKIFNEDNNSNNTNIVENRKYEEIQKENIALKYQIDELNKKIELIKDIVN